MRFPSGLPIAPLADEPTLSWRRAGGSNRPGPASAVSAPGPVMPALGPAGAASTPGPAILRSVTPAPGASGADRAGGDRAALPAGSPVRMSWRDVATALLPVLVLGMMVGWQRLRTGHLDAALLVIGAAGCVLAARQYLVLRSLRGRVDRLAEEAAQCRELAYTDPLTGLANRRGLQDALARQSGNGEPYVLLSLDLDGFKAINDRHGHDAGDSVLVEVARRLRTNLRPGDVPARLGGDEFAVLMVAGMSEARRVAERLTGVLARPYPHAGGKAVLSVSTGVAAGSEGAGGPGVLHRADLALCYAKRRGKNRVECYDSAYDELLRRRFRLEHELRGVLDRGELHVVYQPVVSLPQGRLVGVGASPRWCHPELGEIRTEEFLPLAQEGGMSAELSGWLLHRACQQLAGWLTAGHDVWVSVEVSPRQLQEPEYALQVADVLHEYDIPPHRLVLEITERPAGPGPEELGRRLGALRRTGARIALAGFGADHSSLIWPRRLPIDILKVHRTLLGTPEPVDCSGAPLLDLLVNLGDRLGLTVVAEGVSEPAELTAVTAAGCGYAQGQLFGWGVSARRVAELLAAGAVPTSASAAPASMAPSKPS